ncbi:MAG: PAS domain S-box protein [Taibaiella sp.]|nr:PAS domain S-box protein [Taibaiella sp.]
MAKLNLLIIENPFCDVNMVQKSMVLAGLSVTTHCVKDKNGFVEAIAAGGYDAVVAGHPMPHFSAREALNTLNSKKISIPFIIVAERISQDQLTTLVMEGASDYVLKDSFERLPIAIMNAIEKYSLKADQEKFFNELITRKALMKDAERLAHFGSWKQDIGQNTIYWSDEKFRILGYEPGEVTPSWDNFFVKIHPEDLAFVKQTIKDTVANRNRQKYTFRVAPGKGGIKYIHSEIFITRNADLEVTQLNGFIRDISEHTEAEIKLVESEQKYRNLFENNPSPLWVVEIESKRLLDVNKAAIQLFGYSREEFLSMTAFDIYSEEERRRLKENDIVSPIDLNQKGVWKNVKKDGTALYVEVSTSDIIFEDTNCLIVLSNDITDKLEAINQLKESEARLITSQRIAHIGSWEVDLSKSGPTANAIKWTDESYRIFGFAPDEMEVTGPFFRSLVHPDDQHVMDDALKNALADDGQYIAEFRILLRDGTERIVSELGEIIFDKASKRQLKITGTVQDITDRKRGEEMLLKSEANLRSIFENTETVYVLLDLNLKVVSFNQQASKFTLRHLDKEIKEGNDAAAYFTDAMQVQVKKSLRNALNGANLNFEVRFQEPDGGLKWFYAHFHPVLGEGNKMLGVIMSLRDITERKGSELQEKKITSELIQRNKDLEQFAYIISHNLRAPVANIIGVSEALNDETIDEEERLFFIDGLKTSAKKLDGIITDLNRILQMKHEVTQNKELVQFSQIVKDIQFTIAGITEKEHYQLDYDFNEVDEMITLKSYIHSIFYNLISNSLKYKRPGTVPAMKITSHRTNNNTILIFRDNGLGIDLERNGDKLFGLYKRFHIDAAEGKGMGLYMVKTQVETLNGKISVKSKVNEGTEFIIEFEIHKR